MNGTLVSVNFGHSRILEVLRSVRLTEGKNGTNGMLKVRAALPFWRSRPHSVVMAVVLVPPVVYWDLTVQAPVGTCFIQYTGKGSVWASSTAPRRSWTKVTYLITSHICSLGVPGQACIGKAISEHLFFLRCSADIQTNVITLMFQALISAPLWWNSQDIYCALCDFSLVDPGQI